MSLSGELVKKCGLIGGLLVAFGWLGAPAHAQVQRFSVTELGALGGSTSTGYGISDSGEITGVAMTAGGTAHAFLYSRARGMIDLGTLGGTTSTGYGINSGGQVTGVAMTASGREQAFLYTPGRGLIDLGTLGGVTSVGRAINANGQITGASITVDGERHAFLYENGVMRDLNSMIGTRIASQVTLTSGKGINENGWIVATGVNSRTGQMHAYLLRRH